MGRLRSNTTASKEEIRGCRRDRITHFEIPRHVRFMDQVPMTVTGKVRSCFMREMMQRALSGQRQ